MTSRQFDTILDDPIVLGIGPGLTRCSSHTQRPHRARVPPARRRRVAGVDPGLPPLARRGRCPEVSTLTSAPPKTSRGPATGTSRESVQVASPPAIDIGDAVAAGTAISQVLGAQEAAAVAVAAASATTAAV